MEIISRLKYCQQIRSVSLLDRHMANYFFVDKKKVLNHHPDKRRSRGLPVKDSEDDYFTCITRGDYAGFAFVLNLNVQ